MTSPEKPPSQLRVAVDYRFSLRGFVRATHAAWRSQPAFQVLAATLVLLWVATSFVVGMGGNLRDQLPIFGYMLLAVLFYYMYPPIAFASDPRHRQALRFEFTRDSLTYRRGDTESTLKWSDIKAAVEKDEFYVLELPKRKRVAVPKSAFGPGEEQRFRLLAATSGVQIY